MRLKRHYGLDGGEPRWSLDGRLLDDSFRLSVILELPAELAPEILERFVLDEPAPTTAALPPIELYHEVWASGVTYLRSRVEREAESASADVYARVYEAARPELFFKSVMWRVVGPGEPVRIRKDSSWDVPEPELTLVLNSKMEVVGYTAGNDMSSRSIEGENPLYLPQAKMYNGSCALGDSIVLANSLELTNCPISISIERGGQVVFSGEANTNQMKRSLDELAEYLGREMDFPNGAFLMTGTGIVPGPEFTLQSGDLIKIKVGEVELENPVE